MEAIIFSFVKKTGKKVIILFVVMALIVSGYTYFVGAAVDDSYTKLLMHFEDVEGSTNFIDEAGATTSLVGSSNNCFISTTQSKIGSSSLRVIDGHNNYVTVPASDNYNFGTELFTVDFWVYFESSTIPFFIGNASYSGSTGWMVGWQNSEIKFYINGVNIAASAPAPAFNEWHHIAIVREGTNTDQTKIYIDGVLGGTGTAGNINSTTHNLGIGRGYHDWNQTLTFNGYLDEIRISKGIARWTSNFTPPTSAYEPAPTPTPTPTIEPTPTPTPTLAPSPTPSDNSNYALLEITMVTGEEKEFDLPMIEVDNFKTWYNNKDAGVTGISPTYEINKTYNKGPFISRKEYIVFDKIASFEVMEYTPQVSTQ